MTRHRWEEVRVKTVAWLVVGILMGAAASSGAATAPTVGKPAPAFTLSLLDGRQLSLQDLRGKAVLLNFWHSG